MVDALFGPAGARMSKIIAVLFFLIAGHAFAQPAPLPPNRFMATPAAGNGPIGNVPRAVVAADIPAGTVGGIYPADLFGTFHNFIGDDMAPLQNALNAASAAGGGKVILGEFSYLVSSTITIPYRVSLECAGLGQDIYQVPFSYTAKKCAIYSQVTGTTPAIILKGGMKNIMVLQDRVRTLGDPSTRAAHTTLVNGFVGYGVKIGDGTNPGISNNTDMENVTIGGFTRCINTDFSAQDRKKHVFGDCTNGYFLKDSHDDDKNDHVQFWEFLTTNRAGTIGSWAITGIADNGSGLWRLTIGAHDLLAGEIISIRPGIGGEGIVGRHVVASPTATTIDLAGSAVSPTSSSTTTIGETDVAVTSKTNLRRGMAVSGTGIAASTKIAGIWADRDVISIDIPATASGTNTLTFTSNAYTASSATARFNANYRSGDGFNIQATEGIVCNECFAFGYENGFVLNSVLGANITNSQLDGGHDIGSVTGKGVYFTGASYNNYLQFGLLNGGNYGIVTATTAIAAGFPNTVMANRILADGVLAQAGAGDLILLGPAGNDNASPLFQDDSFRLSIPGARLPQAKVYGETEPAPWLADPDLSPTAFYPSRKGGNFIGRHPTNPYVWLETTTAPVDERVFQINTNTNGEIILRGLNDAASVSLNYMRFTRPSGVANGQVDFFQPILTGSASPTCSSTGTGTTPSCSFGAGSNANAGLIVMTTGTGAPAALGTVTITFANAFTGNNPVCGIWPQDTGAAWNTRATSWMSTQSLSAPVFKWDNNAVALAVSTAYNFGYHCFGK